MLSRLLQWHSKAKQPFSLREKVAVITGGANGIGWQTAQLLYAQGSKVVIIDRDELASQAAAKKLGINALSICADVTDREAMQRAIEQAIKHFGKVDLVIANAGITPPPATLRTSSLADFDQVMSVNVTGVLNTVYPAIETLIAERGHILVVASCAAFCPPIAGAAYMISKAAAEQLARAFKLELSTHGVTVTTAYFGIVDTQLARATLDHNSVGEALHQRLPHFLKSRLTPTRAAEILVTAVKRRATTVVAPAGWLPYAWLRGLVNPVVDKCIANDTSLHKLLEDVEQHSLKNRHSNTSI